MTDTFHPPYFARRLFHRPTDDWPMKGTRGNDVHEMRREYVRRGLLLYRAEYLREKAEREKEQSLFMEAA